jgi:hypothetical protein
MESKKNCERCGKKLSLGIGPDGPVGIEMTGETICGDCYMKMMQAISPPVNDNYEVKEFRNKIIRELTQPLSLDESCFSLYCEQFMSSDVEIKIIDNIYHIKFLYDLIEDMNRWKKVSNYLISWIMQHPLSRRTWSKQTSASQILVIGGQFVFIFIPEEFPEPPKNFGSQVAMKLCPSLDATKIGWMVCPVSTTTIESHNQDINRAISEWAKTQNQPETLRFNAKKVKFHFSPDECDCYIIHR